jgi:hypothetical protein
MIDITSAKAFSWIRVGSPSGGRAIRMGRGLTVAGVQG